MTKIFLANGSQSYKACKEGSKNYYLSGGSHVSESQAQQIAGKETNFYQELTEEVLNFADYAQQCVGSGQT